MSRTFLYFAYGSNMLTKRIHANSTSAVKKCIGLLKDHRLDFNRYSIKWKGASATIIPQEKCEVWGVVWEIDISELPKLDEQEGVDEGIYFAKNVDIETTNGSTLQCKVYEQCNNPKDFYPMESLPEERRPSPVYLKVILKGAKDNQLPDTYIKFLESIPHNNFVGDVDKSVESFL